MVQAYKKGPDFFVTYESATRQPLNLIDDSVLPVGTITRAFTDLNEVKRAYVGQEILVRDDYREVGGKVNCATAEQSKKIYEALQEIGALSGSGALPPPEAPQYVPEVIGKPEIIECDDHKRMTATEVMHGLVSPKGKITSLLQIYSARLKIAKGVRETEFLKGMINGIATVAVACGFSTPAILRDIIEEDPSEVRIV